MGKITIDRLFASLRPGERIFIGSGTAQPSCIMATLGEHAPNGGDIRLVTSAVPGINDLPLDRLPIACEVTGLFMHPGFDDAARARRFRHLPLSYYGFVREIRRQAPIDTLILHVSPPDARGYCSLGPAVEFAPELLKVATRVLAVVNPNVPHMAGSVAVPMSAFAEWCEVDEPLCHFATGTVDTTSAVIGREVAKWVKDGAVLQIGVGKVPSAVLHALTAHRGLRFHSGLIPEEIRLLDESGALHSGPNLACTMLGTADFYAWLAERPDMRVRGCEETHDPARLSALEKLIAVNSAIEVDVRGQANLETIGSRAISSVGGAPDFAHAASQMPDGLSIIALPATSARGHSRIVGRLGPDVTASLPRQVVDIVVTEYGSADLRGKSAVERAEALIAIAAPAFRGELTDALNGKPKRG